NNGYSSNHNRPMWPCLRKQRAEPLLSLASVTPEGICPNENREIAGSRQHRENESLSAVLIVELLSYGTSPVLRSRQALNSWCDAEIPRSGCTMRPSALDLSSRDRDLPLFGGPLARPCDGQCTRLRIAPPWDDGS